MANYEHLPIFQKSFDLMVRIYQETHNFSQEYKYSLGQKIKDTCLLRSYEAKPRKKLSQF